MSSKRLEQIKSARSLNDLLEVVSDIAYEFKNSSVIVQRIIKSLSASTSSTIQRRAGKSAPSVTMDRRPPRDETNKTKLATPVARKAGVKADSEFVQDELVMDMRDENITKPTNAVTDDRYIPPKVADLQKHIAVIHKMYDNAVALDAVEAMLKQTFAGNKKAAAALANIAALKEDHDNTLDDAFEALNVVAEKHLPPKLSSFIDKIEGHLVKIVPGGSYNNMQRQTYVVPDPEDNSLMHFCEYRSFQHFKDKSGVVYPLYHFIVTGVINEQGMMTMHVNCFPDFKRPGKYPLGQEVKTVEAAVKRIDLLLTHNNFAVNHLKQPLPFDTDRAKSMGLTTVPGVVAALVKNDDLFITHNPDMTEAAKLKMVKTILGLLSAVIGINKQGKFANHQLFTYKPIVSKNMYKFSLVPNADKNDLHFSLQQFEEAAAVLGLKTDKQKAAFRFALQN